MLLGKSPIQMNLSIPKEASYEGGSTYRKVNSVNGFILEGSF